MPSEVLGCDESGVVRQTIADPPFPVPPPRTYTDGDSRELDPTVGLFRSRLDRTGDHGRLGLAYLAGSFRNRSSGLT